MADAFDPEALIRRLRAFPSIIEPLARSFTEPESRWKPDEKSWSVLEVINHLADEEADDFPARLGMLLQDPSIEWPPIDPEGWARDRRYNERALGESIERFVKARRGRMAWLDGLAAPEWSRIKTHPKFGSMRAGDLLSAWCAHDTLHLRQIAKRRYQLTLRDAGVFSTEYAGPW